MGGKRVVVRTLDVGADKQADYFHLPPEANPALGMRGHPAVSQPTGASPHPAAGHLPASAYGRWPSCSP